ncbi:Ribonuclease H-like superfamily [Sesbania bispinosa]|nr:Ribonuclease H-like superfamily [Sesbania bispinosa]
MSSGKFLAFQVHKHRVSAEDRKVEAILKLEPPKSVKEMQQLMGKLGYIRRFIPALSELIGPMRELLKESNKYAWEKRHQESFEKIKRVVASAPTMSPPVKGVPLRLYLTVSQHAINGLITQEIEGKERPVSYLSRVMKDTEARYTMQEKYCLGVVYAAQKYRHYFQAHTIHIVSKSEGIKLMLNNSSVTGRLSKWALLISEYNIQLVQPKKLGCQAVTNMMALCLNQSHEETCQEVKGGMPEVNECCVKDQEWWTMKFDGKSVNRWKKVEKKGAKIFSARRRTVQGRIFWKHTQVLRKRRTRDHHGRDTWGCVRKAPMREKPMGRILKNGYYWPSMKEDTIAFAKRCKACQEHGNLIHAPAASMGGITSPYPFYTWVMDFIGPISPTTKEKKWILVATEHYTKWAEAISTKEAKAKVVANFIKENIV